MKYPHLPTTNLPRPLTPYWSGQNYPINIPSYSWISTCSVSSLRKRIKSSLVEGEQARRIYLGGSKSTIVIHSRRTKSYQFSLMVDILPKEQCLQIPTRRSPC